MTVDIDQRYPGVTNGVVVNSGTVAITGAVTLAANPTIDIGEVVLLTGTSSIGTVAVSNTVAVAGTVVASGTVVANSGTPKAVTSVAGNASAIVTGGTAVSRVLWDGIALYDPPGMDAVPDTGRVLYQLIVPVDPAP